MAVIELTREELFELVWSEPASRLTARLGISDVGLTKRCRKHRIPKPPRGHWARVRAGQKVRRPKLPRLKPGEESLDTIRFYEPMKKTTEPPAPKPEWEPVRAQRRYEADHPIRVPQRTGRLHETVQPLRERLASHWNKTPLARALRILSTLARAAEARGFVPSTHPHGARLTITVLDQPLDMRIHELSKRVEVERDWAWGRRTDLEGTGRLRLEIEHHGDRVSRVWSDGKTQQVEGRLNDIMVALVAHAVSRREQERERALREARWEEERRRAEDERRRAEAERAREERLRQMAADREQARQIRELVVAARTHYPVSPELDAWIAWATARAARQDPLSGTCPEFLSRATPDRDTSAPWRPPPTPPA